MEFSELNNPFQKKTKNEQKRFTRKWLPQKLYFLFHIPVCCIERTQGKNEEI